MSKPQNVMLISIALPAATVCTARAGRHKTSRRDAMSRDPRRDRDETLVSLETVSRPRRLNRDHIPG